MALIGDTLYVANTDAIVAFPDFTGAASIEATGKTIALMPAGPVNHHWTKDLIASRDAIRLYAAVESNSNLAENGTPAEENCVAVHCGSRWTSATKSAVIWCRTT